MARFLSLQYLMYRLSLSRHYKLSLIDALSLCPSGVKGRSFLFPFEGVNDNRTQTMADAWPSQMWKTTANSTEFQAIAGLRGGLTSPIQQFCLDGWFSLIRRPLLRNALCLALNDEIREILRLKSRYLILSLLAPKFHKTIHKCFPTVGGC